MVSSSIFRSRSTWPRCSRRSGGVPAPGQARSRCHEAGLDCPGRSLSRSLRPHRTAVRIRPTAHSAFSPASDARRGRDAPRRASPGWRERCPVAAYVPTRPRSWPPYWSASRWRPAFARGAWWWTKRGRTAWRARSGTHHKSDYAPHALTALLRIGHPGHMSEDQSCGACGGSGLTEHTEHTVELDKNGNQVPVTRSWTGSCGACHGSGQG